MVENYFFGLFVFCSIFVITFCGAGTSNAAYFTFKIDERKKWLLEIKDKNQIDTNNNIQVPIFKGDEIERIVSNKTIVRILPD